MPFSGPQGQGPFDDFDDCVSSMEDEEGITDAEALCATWEREARADSEAYEDLSKDRLLQAAADHPRLVPDGLPGADDANDTEPIQRAGAATNVDVVGQPPLQRQDRGVDLANPPEEVEQALEADDFVVYGKASIEQYDVEGTRISVEALEDALDRFFESDDAPGIISRGHTDVPVGMPVREHQLATDTELVIDGERYQFDAGETIRTEAKDDADGDGRPELWLASRLANDSDIARETRAQALEGQLNGYSVTVKPHDRRETDDGEDINAVDLHAVTVGSDEQIKNKGSEFDVAEFKARLRNAPGQMADVLRQPFSKMSNDPDEKSVLGRLLQRAGEDLEDEAETTEQKGDYEDEEDDDDTEEKASPIDRALADDRIEAATAGELRAIEEKMTPEVVETVVDKVSEGNLTIDEATKLLDAGSYEKDMDGNGDDGDEMEMEGDEDQPDGVEAKGDLRETAEAMADEFDVPVDEVMEYLDDVVENGEKDAPGELKSKLDGLPSADRLDELESKLDDLADTVDAAMTEDDMEQKLDKLAADASDEELMTKSEFNDLIQNGEVVGSPVPTAGETRDGPTLRESLELGGGD